jgi:hypothetical protein
MASCLEGYQVDINKSRQGLSFGFGFRLRRHELWLEIMGNMQLVGCDMA